MIVPSCAVFSRSPPRRNSSTPSVALASDPSRGARERSHSRRRFSCPPVRRRSCDGRAEGSDERDEREGDAEGEGEVKPWMDEVDERSAVRTMCECGSVTRQLPECVSHTLLCADGERR